MRLATNIYGLLLLTALTACESFPWDTASKTPPLPGERHEVLPRQIEKATVSAQTSHSNANLPLAAPWYADYSGIEAQYGQPDNHQIHGFSAPRKIWLSLIHQHVPPLFTANDLVTVSSAGTVYAYELAAMDGSNNNIKPRWNYDLFKAGVRKDNIRAGGMAVSGETLFITAGSSVVTALSMANGVPLWVRDVLSPLHAAPLLYQDAVIVLGMDNHLYALHRLTGELLWMHRASEEAVVMAGHTQLVMHNGVLIVPYSNGQLTGINPATGQELWALNLAYTRFATTHIQLNDIGTTPAIHGNSLIVATNAGVLYGIDLRNGQRLWQTGISNVHQLWVAGNYVFTLSSEQQLSALSLVNGTIQWQIVLEEKKDKSKQRQFFGPLIANNLLVIAASDGSVELRSPQDGTLTDTIRLSAPIISMPRVWQQRLWVVHPNGTLTRFE